jgi:hypothetical protein
MTMKWRPTWTLVAMIFLGWFVASQSTSTGQNQPPSKTEQWQYHVEISGHFDENKADQLGGKGWEFVAMYIQREGDFRAIYKRKS